MSRSGSKGRAGFLDYVVVAAAVAVAVYFFVGSAAVVLMESRAEVAAPVVSVAKVPRRVREACPDPARERDAADDYFHRISADAPKKANTGFRRWGKARPAGGRPGTQPAPRGPPAKPRPLWRAPPKRPPPPWMNKAGAAAGAAGAQAAVVVVPPRPPQRHGATTGKVVRHTARVPEKRTGEARPRPTIKQSKPNGRGPTPPPAEARALTTPRRTGTITTRPPPRPKWAAQRQQQQQHRAQRPRPPPPQYQKQRLKWVAATRQQQQQQQRQWRQPSPPPPPPPLAHPKQAFKDVPPILAGRGAGAAALALGGVRGGVEWPACAAASEVVRAAARGGLDPPPYDLSMLDVRYALATRAAVDSLHGGQLHDADRTRLGAAATAAALPAADTPGWQECSVVAGPATAAEEAAAADGGAAVIRVGGDSTPDGAAAVVLESAAEAYNFAARLRAGGGAEPPLGVVAGVRPGDAPTLAAFRGSGQAGAEGVALVSPGVRLYAAAALCDASDGGRVWSAAAGAERAASPRLVAVLFAARACEATRVYGWAAAAAAAGGGGAPGEWPALEAAVLRHMAGSGLVSVVS